MRSAIKTEVSAAGGKTAEEASTIGQAIMGPGSFIKDPISAISFGMALMFGTAGLPHILMRFFTVPDAKEARKSVFWATTWIGYFYVLTFIIGFGAIVLVSTNPEFLGCQGRPDRRQQHGGDPPRQRGGRQRVPRLHLGGGVRDHPRGGGRPDPVGCLGGVARPVRHGVQEGQRRLGRRTAVSRITTLVLGVVAVVLGIAFEKQNIAFMVSLAFAIAASANFPVLFMSVLWKDCTTRGATIGGFLGLITAVVLTVVSPSVWEATLGNPKGSALFPYASPALFSMAAGFIGIWLFSILDNSARAKEDRAGYMAQKVRSETGIGAASASSH
jgi:cation/acetate symporter